MIALAFGILGAFLGIFRREAAEVLTIVAVAVIRRRQSFLDRLLPARRLPGYSANLR
jgi:hypothetical protein